MDEILEGMGKDVLWIVIMGFLVSFVLAVALGANDVANSFGTSVGAKVLTLVQACIIAAIFETLGALIVGARVSETIRKGIFNPISYTGNEELLMIGNLCALLASCIWLFIATWLKLPVSASHCVVGATLGYHIVIFFDAGVDWAVITKIALSWVISPVLSGFISGIIFLIINFTILKKKDPLIPGLISQPIWFLIVIVINLFAILYGSPYIPDAIAWWVSLVAGVGAGLIVAAMIFLFVVPRTRQKILDARAKEEMEKVVRQGLGPLPTVSEEIAIKTTQQENRKNSSEIFVSMTTMKEAEITNLADEPNSVIVPDATAQAAVSTDKVQPYISGSKIQNGNCPTPSGVPENVKPGDSISVQGTALSDQPVKGKHSEEWQAVKDPPEVHTICAPLQVLSASFAAFSHGGNDVSNAIGPLVSLWAIYKTGEVSQENKTEYWILLYGAAGISIGLFVLGRRVIETVGENLTPMTPSNGFSIELGSATTVLLASNLGIPISTTHCKVGSVCAVGWLRSRSAVDWRLFSGIVVAWVVTLPASIALSAAFMGVLQHTVPSLCTCFPYELLTTGYTTSLATTLP